MPRLYPSVAVPVYPAKSANGRQPRSRCPACTREPVDGPLLGRCRMHEPYPPTDATILGPLRANPRVARRPFGSAAYSVAPSGANRWRAPPPMSRGELPPRPGATKAQCSAGTSPGSDVPSKANPGPRGTAVGPTRDQPAERGRYRAAKPPARGRGIASQSGFNRMLESYLQGILRAAPRGARTCRNNMPISAIADKHQAGLVNSLGRTVSPI
jgi:hypothetical protein